MRIKFKKDDPVAVEGSVRYCTKCGCELPSKHKFEDCDSCRRTKAKTATGFFAAIASILAVIVGLLFRKKI